LAGFRMVLGTFYIVDELKPANFSAGMTATNYTQMYTWPKNLEQIALETCPHLKPGQMSGTHIYLMHAGQLISNCFCARTRRFMD